MRQRHNSPRWVAGAWLLLHGALLSLLPACQPGPDPTFDRYLDSVAAALSLKSPGSQTGRAIPPPPAGAVQLDISVPGIQGLDILALRGCAVQRNVIRRDTSLARLAKPSQQLLLTLEYLRQAPNCIRQLRGRDNALAARLRDAWQQQKAQLPAMIFNATLGGDEYTAFWRAVPAPGEFPRVSPRESSAALHAIEALVRRWLAGDFRAQDRDVELWLGAAAGGAGGQHWETLARRGDALVAADEMLARHGAAAPCTTREIAALQASASAALRTRFQRDVEPLYLRSLHRYRQLLHPIAGLETQLDAVLPPLYRQWMDNRNQRFVSLAAAPQRHLRQLGQLRQPCATQ